MMDGMTMTSRAPPMKLLLTKEHLCL